MKPIFDDHVVSCQDQACQIGFSAWVNTFLTQFVDSKFLFQVQRNYLYRAYSLPETDRFVRKYLHYIIFFVCYYIVLSVQWNPNRRSSIFFSSNNTENKAGRFIARRNV
jgi:hypothetical protein